MKNCLLTLRTVFAWGVARGDLLANPAAAVDVPTVLDKPPAIHTPAEVRRVLESSLASDPTVCRVFAVRYFGGLRTSEAVALSENEIRPAGAKYIEVTAAKSKTRKRRLVEIQPALAAWLKVTAAAGAALPLAQVNNRLRAAVIAAGVPWSAGVCRHSFVSYHLARFKNAGRTALEAGHSENILFAHYREVVTAAAAREFWRILPKN
jgi:integrase